VLAAAAAGLSVLLLLLPARRTDPGTATKKNAATAAPN
jgi:hypothetical protein